MTFTIFPAGPLDADGTLARYHVWGDDPVNRVSHGVFRRVTSIDGRLVPWEARWSGGVDAARLDVAIHGARGRRVVDAVRSELTKIFGLGFDLEAFYRFAKADRVLASLMQPLRGLRPTLTPNGLEMLIGSISAQQVNLQFAFTCRARLVRRYGTPVPVGDDVLYAFPDADRLSRAPLSELRAMQYSSRKAEYIHDVAEAIVRGALDLDTLESATDEGVVDTITGLRGLGRWTADWYLARCLGRGDACPAGDLGVRRAFERYYGRGRTLADDAVRRRARAWGPYRNLAIHYLLAGLRLGLEVA
jgi:DNA-3-methyladenine glycosylase II